MKKAGIKTGLFFSISSMLKSGGTMLAGIIMIRWIEPYEIGLWQSIWVFSSYTGFLQLGVMSGLNREIPFHLGADQKDKAYSLAAAGEFFALVLAGFSVASILMVLVIWNLVSEISPMKFWGIAGVGLIVATNFYQNYLVVTFRSSRDFKHLSEVYLIDSFLILGLLALIYRFHYYGIVAYYAINSILITILLYVRRPIKVTPAFDKQAIVTLIRVWLPMFVLSYLKQISKTFPRVILLSVGGVLAVGYFAPAQAIQTAMLLLPNVLAQYIYPQMSYRFGQTNNKNDLWIIVLKTLSYLFLVGIPLVVAGWFLLPPFITYFFPKYVESIFPSQLMLIAGLFMASTLVYNAFYSIKAYKQDLWLTVSMLILNSGLPFLFTMIMKPVDGAAMGWLMACFLFFIIMVLTLRKQLKSPNLNPDDDISGLNPVAAD